MSVQSSSLEVVPYREPGTPMPVHRRWWIWASLGVLLLFGGYVRFHQIARESLWPDEFWSVYISTGRGDQAFVIPGGKLLGPPPQEMMAGAPSWIHIWTGMGTAVHPPLYHILLRWWMDLFGEGDFATRALSAFLALLSIVLLFDVVRRTSGPGRALAAAAVMALSASQVDFSQETRSYTMIVVLGLLAIQAVVRMEQGGATRMRLWQLGFSSAALLLTHYFTCFGVAGLGAYALVRLRGKDRTRATATLVASIFFVVAVWAYWFVDQHQRNLMAVSGWARESNFTLGRLLLPIVYLPAFHLYFREEYPVPVVIAVIVYILPLIFVRRNPQLLIWWFWTIGVIAGLTIFDAMQHALLATFPKYTFLATPAIAALAAAPLPWRSSKRKNDWITWILPALIILSLLNNTISRMQEGPTPKADWRLLAKFIDQGTGPGTPGAGPSEPLIFYTGSFWRSPAFWYLAFNHYAPQSHRPIMFLYGTADADALAQLAQYPSVCVVGENVGRDGPRLLPGYQFAKGGASVQFVGDYSRMVRSPDAPRYPPITLPEPSPGPRR